MKRLQTTKVFDCLQKAMAEGYTVVSAQGSSRSAKTYNIAMWLICYAIEHPNAIISIVRKTLPALKGSVVRDVEEIMGRMGILSQIYYNKSEHIFRFPNGAFIEYFSTDDEAKLRGRKRDVLFVNEATELSEIEWRQLKMRTTKLAILDYNPSYSDEHWLCLVNKDARTYHFITTYKDNPFLEQTIIDEIESLRETNNSLWQVYGLGLQCRVEGLVFPAFDKVKEIPPWVKHRCLALDYGFTNDPTAIVECGVYEDKLFIDELAYSTRMLTEDIIEVCKRRKGLKAISEVDNRLIEELYRAGIDIIKVRKGEIMAGINKMQAMKLCVTTNSINVMKELKNYTFAQDKEGKWLNKPIDRFNHAIDAVRYYVITELMDMQNGGRGMRVNILRDF